MADQFSSFTPDVTNEDKLWAALAYVFSPLVPIILFLMEDKKNRPFIRMHNVQALVAGIVIWILSVVLGTVIPCIGSLIWLPLWIMMILYALKAYKGEAVRIPVVTDFVKNQGWG